MSARSSGAEALGSDHHPDFLHPGRTALILLEDVGELDARVLAAGTLAESRHPELRVEEEQAREIFSRIGPSSSGADEAYGWWRGLPLPTWTPSKEPDASGTDADARAAADIRMLEDIVTAPPPVQRVVLAEALDVLRHAHLRPGRSERRRAVELAERVLIPVAPRVHEVLARRFEWWLRRVGRALRH